MKGFHNFFPGEIPGLFPDIFLFNKFPDFSLQGIFSPSFYMFSPDGWLPCS
jgi:hypothetical protein